MANSDEIRQFIDSWRVDTLTTKPAFLRYYEFLGAAPDLELDFKARPGISYSVRAKNRAQKNRELFALIDVIDDEQESRWLSVCFYADLVNDPKELGDFVPSGLLGEDALCFNLESSDPEMEEYILERIREAAERASQ